MEALRQEFWNNGILDKNREKDFPLPSETIIPTFQYSIIPYLSQ
jgi:hypothetical protein